MHSEAYGAALNMVTTPSRSHAAATFNFADFSPERRSQVPMKFTSNRIIEGWGEVDARKSRDLDCSKRTSLSTLFHFRVSVFSRYGSEE